MSSVADGKVVILDRDGTIVHDRAYASHPEELEFLPRAAEGLRLLHQHGYRLVVISNQSGVWRGCFSLEQLQAMNARLLDMVAATGAKLERIYCCPHRPDENCSCRKPNTELARRAALELGFDSAKAIVIGDKASDVEFGRRIGAVTMLIAGSDQSARPAPVSPDYVVPDLGVAAAVIHNLKLGCSSADEPGAAR